MQKIYPCLWFDDQAEEAVAFYTSVFKNSKIGDISYYGEGSPRTPGMVMAINFQIEGQDYLALNGGPEFTFSPAISLIVNCETQAEIDDLWAKLTEGGQEVQCGWLTDKFGVSWQINYTALDEMLRDKDPVKVRRVMEAMLSMVKLDVAALQRAYEQR